MLSKKQWIWYLETLFRKKSDLQKKIIWTPINANETKGILYNPESDYRKNKWFIGMEPLSKSKEQVIFEEKIFIIPNLKCISESTIQLIEGKR